MIGEIKSTWLWDYLLTDSGMHQNSKNHTHTNKNEITSVGENMVKMKPLILLLLILFDTAPGGAKSLFLTLHSGIILECAQGTFCNAGNWILFGVRESKTLPTISLFFPLHSFLGKMSTGSFSRSLPLRISGSPFLPQTPHKCYQLKLILCPFQFLWPDLTMNLTLVQIQLLHPELF